MFRLAPVFCSLILLSGPVCGGTEITAPDIIISVREQKLIGQPASYGCIRMKSSDVAALYNQLSLGALVQIVPDGLPKLSKVKTSRIMPMETHQPSGIVAPAAKSAASERGLHWPGH